jgi:hypothetical protein
MVVHVIVGIVAIVCAATCGITRTFVSFKIIDSVNERLPEESQFDPLGWYYTKTQRLHREYKRLYPSGDLLLKLRLLTAIMFACMLICAWGFGFFTALMR